MLQQFSSLGGMKPDRVIAPANKLFGIESTSDVSIWKNVLNPYIPTINKNYVFQTELLRELLTWLDKPTDDGFWLYGHLGTGKSSVLEQLAARMNLAVYTQTGSETMDMEELIYSTSFDNGTSRIKLGALAKAFTYGGLFIFNEIDYCQPHHIAALNDILSGNTITIQSNSGEIVKLEKHPCFYFAVASNTNGTPDDEAPVEYHGTGPMNPAFKDRFLFFKLGYLKPEDELKVVLSLGFEETVSRMEITSEMHKAKVYTNYRLIFEPVIKNMIKVANDTRNAVDKGNFDRPLTLRCLKRWIQRGVAWQGTKHILHLTAKSAFLNGLSSRQRVVIEQFCADRFGDDWSLDE
ncbi:MAG: AAA family ATPase [Moritella sp.]|uniref:AAA family ATPase n=1 Tax=Moritella sp. TaxID=78556 RepID=UPI001D62E218|nr:AAA family ATPase [Moritella sp.]NQZ49663.1 AAA family ATPase [Moritella sp.]